MENKEKRKLATIAKIENISPIEGADAIEVVTIRGWKVVTKKNEFKPGDFCVYCEIDSVLPEKEEFEFLRKNNFRIKTIKLRGQVSQGIVFPLSILPTEVKVEEGLNVTDILGITKYEPVIPVTLSGTAKGYFPSHSIKTDEERIQNLVDKFDELKTYKYFATEKLDGSSATYFLKDNVFGVCSRNLELIETEDNVFWKVARELKIEEKMRTYAEKNGITNFNIQGELIGEGIQGNKYAIKGHTVRFFRSFNIDTFEFFDYKIFIKMIEDMELLTVPILGVVELPKTIDELLAYVEGKSVLNPKIEREGIVFVSTDIVPKYNGRLSFKGISNKFLLKNNE